MDFRQEKSGCGAVEWVGSTITVFCILCEKIEYVLKPAPLEGDLTMTLYEHIEDMVEKTLEEGQPRQFHKVLMCGLDKYQQYDFQLSSLDEFLLVFLQKGVIAFADRVKGRSCFGW